MDASLIQTIAVYALPVIFAITLHEAAHGYAARLLGDNTAYMMGRVSFNPMRHIDPLGTIAIPLVMYFLTGGAFLFGYAKPVPVSFGNLRNPRWGSLWVSLAGPACNFVQALIWGVLTLFPLPPLDGGRILAALLPTKQSIALSRIEPYGFIIVLVLVTTGVLTNFWLRPLVNVGYAVLSAILSPFASLL